MSQESLSLIEPTTRLPHECAGCHQRWNGYNTAHCCGCHQTFTGITAFDRHRDGSHSAGTRHCLAPESAGLVSAGRAYPCWGLPGADNHWTTENSQETQ